MRERDIFDPSGRFCGYPFSSRGYSVRNFLPNDILMLTCSSPVWRDTFSRQCDCQHEELAHHLDTAIEKLGFELEEEYWNLAWRYNPTWCLRMIDEGRLPAQLAFLEELLA